MWPRPQWTFRRLRGQSKAESSQLRGKIITRGYYSPPTPHTHTNSELQPSITSSCCSVSQIKAWSGLTPCVRLGHIKPSWGSRTGGGGSSVSRSRRGCGWALKRKEGPVDTAYSVSWGGFCVLSCGAAAVLLDHLTTLLLGIFE